MSTSLRQESFSVENVRGDAVHGDLRWVEDGRVKPAVILCHGFKGFKDWGPFPTWGRALARTGFVAVHFNFSYNGVTPEHPTQFADLEAFAENTYTRELDDVDAVTDYVLENTNGLAPVDGKRIGLMGHSRGGGIAILHADQCPDIDSLVTWSSVDTFLGRFGEEQIREWKDRGYVEVINSRTGQTMRLNRVLYDDARKNRNRLDIIAAARRLTVPWMIVHAEDDASVAMSAARCLADAQPDATLMKATGGHTFGGKHPHDDDVPASLREVWNATLSHFNQTLS
ncbi:alpha/beta hydrolase family protein [Longibacter sp.]|uniref:alpha/beta hydrolase family protein n=1 Tax=Longibacter sp. TaxID=2045415 RepID=UPI003EB9344E